MHLKRRIRAFFTAGQLPSSECVQKGKWLSKNRHAWLKFNDAIVKQLCVRSDSVSGQSSDPATGASLGSPSGEPPLSSLVAKGTLGSTSTVSHCSGRSTSPVVRGRRSRSVDVRLYINGEVSASAPGSTASAPLEGTSQRLPDSQLSSPSGELAAINTGSLRPPPGLTAESYPTDAKQRRKEREKAAKEAGTPLEVVKQHKHVENHWDDCGEDVSSLSQSLDYVTSQFTDFLKVNPDFAECWDLEDDPEPQLEDHLACCMFYGQIPTVGRLTNVPIAKDISELYHVVGRWGPGQDVAELSSATVATAQFSLRRKLDDGPNQDIACLFSLTSSRDQQTCIQYFAENPALVVVMTPLNYAVDEVAWLCGEVARNQLLRERDFLVCQPPDTTMFNYPPWPHLFAEYPRVAQVAYNRCQCGYSSPEQMIVTTSCPEMGIPFTNTVCNSNCAHVGTSEGSYYIPLAWTWEESQRVVDGIFSLRARDQRGYSIHYAYGVFPGRDKVPMGLKSEQPKIGNDHRAPPKDKSPCKGCKWMRARNS